MTDPLSSLVIGWEQGEIESLAKSRLAPETANGTLTEAQADLLIAAAPVFANLLIARFLAKQGTAGVPPES